MIKGRPSCWRDDDGDEKKSGQKQVRFRVEGERAVDPQVVDGVERVIIVSDDGIRDAKRFAGHLLLDLGRLQTET